MYLRASIVAALAMASVANAQSVSRSRAVQYGAGDPRDLTPPAAPPVARDPDDGDDLLPEVRRPVPASSRGALGRTVGNTIGIAPGSVLVRSAERRLYYGLSEDLMRVYPVAVGKAGAQWRGTAVVGRKAARPTWHPTARQRKRKRLPAVVRPGAANPLGTRAIYLFRGGRDTLYRIHGTNSPGSIGRAVSSGCLRMRNADVEDLYSRISVGARVTVR